MTTAGSTAFGVTFTWDGNAVAEIRDIKAPKMEAEDVDMTTHTSTSGFKEYLSGLKEGGECTLECNLINTDTDGQLQLAADIVTGTTKTGVVTFPDGSSWTFTGYAKSFEVVSDKANALIANIGVKVTGVPTFAYTTSGGLTDLSPDSGTLVPTFANTTYTYVLEVVTGTTTVTFTPTFGAGTTTINGSAVTTGNSIEITIGAAGSVTEVAVINQETGKKPVTYTVYVSRAAS